MRVLQVRSLRAESAMCAYSQHNAEGCGRRICMWNGALFGTAVRCAEKIQDATNAKGLIDRINAQGKADFISMSTYGAATSRTCWERAIPRASPRGTLRRSRRVFRRLPLKGNVLMSPASAGRKLLAIRSEARLLPIKDVQMKLSGTMIVAGGIV